MVKGGNNRLIRLNRLIAETILQCIHISNHYVVHLKWIYCYIFYSILVIWDPLVAQLVKNLLTMQETLVRFLGWEEVIVYLWEAIGYPVQYSWTSLVAQGKWDGKLDGKESICNVEDLGSIPGLGRRSCGGGPGNPLQCSCLENPHGQRSLVGYSPWSHEESDKTEWLSIAQHISYIQYL